MSVEGSTGQVEIEDVYRWMLLNRCPKCGAWFSDHEIDNLDSENKILHFKKCPKEWKG